MKKDNVEFDNRLDLWDAAWRHYPIVIITTLFCGVLGGIYCAVTPAVYESQAEVLIEEKHSPAFNEQTLKDRPTIQNDVETHMLVLKSPMIFEAADKAEGITSLGLFKNIETNDWLEYWDEHLTLSIPEFNANVLSVSFRGKNPEECQKVVEAVVEAYERHLKSKSAGLGQEVSKLVNEAKDELLDRLDKMEKEYATFRRNAPVMWKEGAAVNLHNERQIDLEARRKELIIEKSITEAKLAAIVSALESGSQSARDAIYYEALIELQRADEKDQHIEREAARGYSQELSREFMQLAMEEKRMAAEFGDGHPDLKVLRVRLAEMKQALRAALGDESNGSQIGGEKVDFVAVYTRLLSERINSYRSQISKLDSAYREEELAGTEIEDFLTEDERHRSNIRRTQTLFDAVVARLEEINIIQDYGGESMEIIAKPSLGEKVWPSIPIVGAVSGFLGMLLGVAWGLFREITDRVFRNPTEIRSLLGVPVLGQVPTIKPNRNLIRDEYTHIKPCVDTLHDTHSRFAESFRGVRTAIQFSSRRKDHRLLQVTSPLPGDGKSTVVANMAVTAAKSGKKVLIIDGDMRRPQIHRIFGAEVEGGLADVLSGHAEATEVIKEVGVEGLSIITAGVASENPAELLVGEAFEDLLGCLKDEFEFVIVDSPPLLAVSDPAVIATYVDGVVLVLNMRKGVRQTALKAKELLLEVDSNLIGVIVNGVGNRSRKSSYGYDYGYGYGYGYTGSRKYYESKLSINSGDANSSKGGNQVSKNGLSNTRQSNESENCRVRTIDYVDDTHAKMDEDVFAIHRDETVRD